MTRDASGAALVGRILARLAVQDGCTAAGLARDLGAARATTFAVLRGLEVAGLVSRDAKGVVSPGEKAAALGCAALGLGRLAGPAHALLPILRDETDGVAELIVRHASGERALVTRVPAGWRSALSPENCTLLDEHIQGAAVPAILRLRLQRSPSKAERDRFREAVAAVAAALSRALRSDPPQEQP